MTGARIADLGFAGSAQTDNTSKQGAGFTQYIYPACERLSTGSQTVDGDAFREDLGLAKP